jgi:hypothetical protein
MTGKVNTEGQLIHRKGNSRNTEQGQAIPRTRTGNSQNKDRQFTEQRKGNTRQHIEQEKAMHKRQCILNAYKRERSREKNEL